VITDGNALIPFATITTRPPTASARLPPLVGVGVATTADAVAVGLEVGGVAVRVGVGVVLGVPVGVGIAVCDGVGVDDGRRVLVAVGLCVRLGVALTVGDDVAIGVAVAEAVAAVVGVAVRLGVTVGVPRPRQAGDNASRHDPRVLSATLSKLLSMPTCPPGKYSSCG